jgi:hypothetical protein
VLDEQQEEAPAQPVAGGPDGGMEVGFLDGHRRVVTAAAAGC